MEKRYTLTDLGTWVMINKECFAKAVVNDRVLQGGRDAPRALMNSKKLDLECDRILLDRVCTQRLCMPLKVCFFGYRQIEYKSSKDR